MAKKRRTEIYQGKINFWWFLRDVFLGAMSKGQLLLTIFGIVLIIIILRMPGEDLGTLANEILVGFKNASLVGYLVAVLAIVGWYIHVRKQRSRYEKEMKRLAKVRNELQSKLQVKSS